MSLWLFNVFMDGVKREGKEGPDTNYLILWNARYEQEWKIKCLICANDTRLLGDSEEGCKSY